MPRQRARVSRALNAELRMGQYVPKDMLASCAYQSMVPVSIHRLGILWE